MPLAKSEIKRPWFTMKAADGAAEIQIFDEIGGWFGVTVTDFKRAFDEIKGSDSIRLLINSPGGDVFAGVAIYNILSGVRPKLTAEVVGLAASAASVVALAASSVVMGQGAYFMIHDPWGVAIGTADDMLKMAETLESMRGQFADIYSERSDLSRDDAIEAMSAETWYTADEAIEAGFADEVKDYGEAAASISLTDAKRLVIESRINTRIEMSRMKREAEAALRDAGLSRSSATAETARIFEAQRDAEPEALSDSEGQDVPSEHDDALAEAARRLAALTRFSIRKGN